jgi:hypothetical protein
MNFIETWFHLSPDNGSGITEVMYVVAAAALVIGVLARRQIAAFAKWCADRVRKNR